MIITILITVIIDKLVYYFGEGKEGKEGNSLMRSRPGLDISMLCIYIYNIVTICIYLIKFPQSLLRSYYLLHRICIYYETHIQSCVGHRINMQIHPWQLNLNREN